MRNHSGFKNHILSEFSSEDLAAHSGELVSVPLIQRASLYLGGNPLDFVYFPEDGVGSVLTIMADGSTVEVGMIGREGVIGIAGLLGGRASIQDVVVQIPGTAWRMSVNAARNAFNLSSAMRVAVHRFTESFLNVGAQTAACNRLHTIEQRCARWLLMVRDRVDSNTMPMTHEFLSSMLGVRRTGVTLVAKQLRAKGLIHYRRGQLEITDYEGLIAVACECYLIDHHRLDVM